MKKIVFAAMILLSFTMISFKGNKLHVDVYKVDTKQSRLEWVAEKLTGKHNGTIGFLSGELKDNHGVLSGSFEFDMKTIEDKDMESAEGRAKLEGHLKSADFFNVEKFPVSKFVLVSLAPLPNAKPGGNTHNAKGMLTIKDKTNEITFDVIVNRSGNAISCNGSAIVDRTKFDVMYRSKSFFPDIGDKMIYDDFTLKFIFVAVR